MTPSNKQSSEDVRGALDEIREYADKASAAPWSDTGTAEDAAEFIAKARTDLPLLLAVAEAVYKAARHWRFTINTDENDMIRALEALANVRTLQDQQYERPSSAICPKCLAEMELDNDTE